MSAFTDFTQPCTGVSIASARKKISFSIKDIRLGKREVSLSLSADDMVSYENPKEFTKISPELIRDFSKIVRSVYKN